MIMTVLEAMVPKEKWAALEQRFRTAGEQLPPQITHSCLVQSTSDPTLWRIVTVWRDREALQAYKQAVETPEGVLMFRSAGAEPTLSSFDVSVMLSA